MGSSQMGAAALWQIAQEMRRGSEYHQTVVFKNEQNATKTRVSAGFGITEKRARAIVVQYDEAVSAAGMSPRTTECIGTPGR